MLFEILNIMSGVLGHLKRYNRDKKRDIGEI